MGGSTSLGTIRVLIFHGYLLRGTGSNVYNASLAQALARLGHEVHLLCQDREAGALNWVDGLGRWADGRLHVEPGPGCSPPGSVTAYVPEAGSSGYAGATVRDLLDMRTGVAFRETYTELDAEVRVMERSMGWRPAQPGDPAGAYPYLITLGQAGPHGGEFTYRSADSDMLGWVCERASGTRMADLISALIWQPMGAERDGEITCDPLGSAIHDGGVSATARDLARFGQLLVDDGCPIIPAAWLAATRDPGPGVREAFAATDNELVLPGGWYRNQFWVIPGPGGPVLVCLGIHGQLVYADRATRTVVVKMSSWPDAQNTAYLLDTLRACAALAAGLSAGGL